MCAYLSKSESEGFLVMTQAIRDAFEKELNNFEQIKPVANVYINKRECVFRSVYTIFYEVNGWEITIPSVILANSITPGKRFPVFRVCLREDEISVLTEDSKKIFNWSIVDCYMDHPNATSSGGKYAAVDEICFAEFSRFYYLPSNPKYKENIFN